MKSISTRIRHIVGSEWISKSGQMLGHRVDVTVGETMDERLFVWDTINDALCTMSRCRIDFTSELLEFLPLILRPPLPSRTEVGGTGSFTQDLVPRINERTTRSRQTSPTTPVVFH